MTFCGDQGVPGEHEEAAREEGERPAGGQQGADREHQEESCFFSKFSAPDYFFFPRKAADTKDVIEVRSREFDAMMEKTVCEAI